MIEITERDRETMLERRGLFCEQHEWFVGGAIGDSFCIIGLLEPPVEGGPIVARFTDGAGHWSHFHACQQIAPNLYRCLVNGTIFDWLDEHVKVYSALARVTSGLRLDLETGEASLDGEAWA